MIGYLSLSHGPITFFPLLTIYHVVVNSCGTNCGVLYSLRIFVSLETSMHVILETQFSLVFKKKKKIKTT